MPDDAYRLNEQYFAGMEQGFRRGYADGYRDGRKAKQIEAMKPRRVRRPLSDYERVAEIYRKACDEGMAVQASVAQEMGVTPTQAGTLIHAARKLGLLPPTTRGKARF